MRKLSQELINFFQRQGFVIVATVGSKKWPHCACKGIVKIDPKGKIYILDLYQGQTYKNLRVNPVLSITAVDEHRFKGYCLKGRGRILNKKNCNPEIVRAWEDKITARITQRLLKNIHEEKGHPRHPEALLPKPQYLIVMTIEEIIDLIPHHLR
jgi:predicted pyridoxine 5'-phosphate oxidase superfamily flavin-nucleotide-binding protein